MRVAILFVLIDNEDHDKKEESSKKKVLTVDMVNEGIKVRFFNLFILLSNQLPNPVGKSPNPI